jgi:hypothetical protein
VFVSGQKLALKLLPYQRLSEDICFPLHCFQCCVTIKKLQTAFRYRGGRSWDQTQPVRSLPDGVARTLAEYWMILRNIKKQL